MTAPRALQPSPWQPARPPAGSTWADFTGWVTWLDTAYEMNLPGCWSRHEGLVHPLSALWHLWRQVYAAPSPGTLPAPGGPASWHVQYLYPFLDRLADQKLPGHRCRHGAHKNYEHNPNLTDALGDHGAHAMSNGAVQSEAGHARLDVLGPVLGATSTIGVLYAEPS